VGDEEAKKGMRHNGSIRLADFGLRPEEAAMWPDTMGMICFFDKKMPRKKINLTTANCGFIYLLFQVQLAFLF
jgi:hypothetical protein